MSLQRIACFALVFVLPLITGNPPLRNCSDVNIDGAKVEGYYVVFPNDPYTPSLVYCGVSDGMIPSNTSDPKTNAKNCQDLKDLGMTDSGLNAIYPYAAHPETPVIVYCDQELLGGGWTIFQQRDDFDSQLDFYRSFDDYAIGFGNVGGEFWLGLDIIHELTQQSVNELYVNLESWGNITKYAHYKTFYVSPRIPEVQSMHGRPYFMSVSHYSGTAGDSLSIHLGMPFTTHDEDHDDFPNVNCATEYHGAWWYNYHNCFRANLNSRYHEDATVDYAAVNWLSFSGIDTIDKQSLKKVSMAVRPLKQ